MVLTSTDTSMDLNKLAHTANSYEGSHAHHLSHHRHNLTHWKSNSSRMKLHAWLHPFPAVAVRPDTAALGVLPHRTLLPQTHSAGTTQNISAHLRPGSSFLYQCFRVNISGLLQAGTPDTLSHEISILVLQPHTNLIS